MPRSPCFANADVVKRNTASLHPAELNEDFLPTLLARYLGDFIFVLDLPISSF